MLSIRFLILSLFLAASPFMGVGCTPSGNSDNTDMMTDNTTENSNGSTPANENEGAVDNDNTAVGNDNSTDVPSDDTCDPPCTGGRTCVDGFCTPVAEPQAQVGFTNEDTDAYDPILEGGTMPIFTFGQGGSHMFVTVRLAGFTVPEDAEFEVTYIMFWQVDDSPLSGFEEILSFEPLEGGVFEASRRVVFISEFPETLDGTMADFTLIVTSPTDPDQTVRIERTLLLELREE